MTIDRDRQVNKFHNSVPPHIKLSGVTPFIKSPTTLITLILPTYKATSIPPFLSDRYQQNEQISSYLGKAKKSPSPSS
ncbi:MULTISPECIES: hypothetical protein [Okeania]|uniref:hypothetical protein n=1 Tax=Okeania TaxID=1458928 RepID=UPI000F53BDCC|nr:MULTISPECIES: hypothetical protein [Okeania]NET12431.1 hypothetical protein [Okeania sp. SIO1H6]NES77405.1 hypothetical protein [Okeania sp. SIO1H4]NES89623.1 hypothetical protein [Okeania sp. SIO2B9]NET21018.1 hypothetical protein [Okeania sp. SIO1H5]NET77194.1 hypothetical protein [Okeania sp. SIO1F9]